MATDAEQVAKLTGKSMDVAPKMRGAFMQGLVTYCNRQNKSLPEVMADWWQEDWKAAGQLLTKFMPREVKVDGKVKHDHEHRVMAVSRINEFIIEAQGSSGEGGDLEGTRQTGPVLPAEIPAE